MVLLHILTHALTIELFLSAMRCRRRLASGPIRCTTAAHERLVSILLLLMFTHIVVLGRLTANRRLAYHDHILGRWSTAHFGVSNCNTAAGAETTILYVMLLWLLLSIGDVDDMLCLRLVRLGLWHML